MAVRGTYDSIKHYVELNDDVDFYMVRKDNATFHGATKDAFIDMDNGIMKSDSPVKLTSDSGSLSAEKFVIDREKEKITFQGAVKLVIF